MTFGKKIMAKIYQCSDCHEDLEYCHAKNCWKYNCNCKTTHVYVTSDEDIKLCVAVIKRLEKSEYYSTKDRTWWKD